jgi:hypothetical protein
MVDKLPFLSDDHHYAVAQVAARSSQLDHMIEMTAGSLMLETPHTAAFVVRNLNHDRLVGVIGALLRDFFPEEEEEHKRLIALITSVRKERNKLMHWVWGKADDYRDAMKIGSLRPYHDNLPPTTLTAAQIQVIASQMLAACHQLRHWTDRNHERIKGHYEYIEQQRALLDRLLQQALLERLASPPEQGS